MDVYSLVRTMGALALLLGLLAGALWAVRRFDLRLPGAVGQQRDRRLDLVERLSIDQRRSAVLIRCDDREHVVLLSPEGQLLLETRACTDGEVSGTQPVGDPVHLPSFPSLLEKKMLERENGAWHWPDMISARKH